MINREPITQEEAQKIFLYAFYHWPDKVDDILVNMKHLLDKPYNL
jgi:hypothetical protein